MDKRTAGLEGMTDGAPALAGTRVEQGDNYLERVAKYVPAELVAFYIFANPILMQSQQVPGTMAGFSVAQIGSVIFFATWALTPIYLWQLSTPDDTRLTNIVAATALFPVWAYAVRALGRPSFSPMMAISPVSCWAEPHLPVDYWFRRLPNRTTTKADQLGVTVKGYTTAPFS